MGKETAEKTAWSATHGKSHRAPDGALPFHSSNVTPRITPRSDGEPIPSLAPLPDPPCGRPCALAVRCAHSSRRLFARFDGICVTFAQSRSRQ